MDIAQLVEDYGGTINAALVIGLFTAWVTRLGQRDTKKLQEKANVLASDKQNFDQQKELTSQWREDFLKMRERNDVLRERLDEADKKYDDLEAKYESLQNQYLNELKILGELLYKDKE